MSKILKQGESRSAVCPDCNQRMISGNGCSADLILIGPICYRRIPAGTKFDMVPYEGDDKFCHDCNVKYGQFHHLGCDMERCPSCFGQLISCGCHVRFMLEEEILRKKRAAINIIKSV